MTKVDLMNALGVPSSDFSSELSERMKKSLIINIFLNNGEVIKIGAGSDERIKISSIIAVKNDFFTIRYDSHDTNILYSGICKVEYFHKDYGEI